MIQLLRVNVHVHDGCLFGNSLKMVIQSCTACTQHVCVTVDRSLPSLCLAYT